MIVRFVSIVSGSERRDERGADDAADLEGELRRHLARRDEGANQLDLSLAGEEERPRRQAITTRKLADVANEPLQIDLLPFHINGLVAIDLHVARIVAAIVEVEEAANNFVADGVALVAGRVGVPEGGVWELDEDTPPVLL